MHAPTRTGPRRATVEQRISILRARIEKLDERIGALMSQRVNEEEKLAAELRLLERITTPDATCIMPCGCAWGTLLCPH